MKQEYVPASIAANAAAYEEEQRVARAHDKAIASNPEMIAAQWLWNRIWIWFWLIPVVAAFVAVLFWFIFLIYKA